MKKITVMGSGGWGTAMAMSAASTGNDVTVWSAFPEEIERIVSTGENPLLPGIQMPKELKFTSDINVVKDADIIITAVPSFAVASVAQKIAGVGIPASTVLVNISKTGFRSAFRKRFRETRSPCCPVPRTQRRSRASFPPRWSPPQLTGTPP